MEEDDKKEIPSDPENEAERNAGENVRNGENGLTNEQFDTLKRHFSAATPEKRQEIAREIAGALFEDIRLYAKRITRGEGARIEGTSVAICAYMRASGFLGRMDDLEPFGSVENLMQLFRKTIFCVMIDKYRQLNRHPAAPIDGGGGCDGYEPADAHNHVQETMENEIAEKLHNIMCKHLEPQDFDLLMARFEKGLSYPDIVKALDTETIEPDDVGKQADCLRHKVKTILRKLSQLGEVQRLGGDGELV
ncbi:MAG: hypothetical protein Q4D38_01020 [Planctomycetia bacterium]|nr:hypothetical protein [Planctomycetia bacterium]